MIEVKKLKQLIQLMKDNELTELDIRDNDESVKLKRGGGGEELRYIPTTGSIPMDVGGVAGVEGAEAGKVVEENVLDEITSPMVGTFYSAASPDSEPYVRVGSEVNDETVVCVIEAMKVFNEIKAEINGTIEKVLVSNGEAVEFGQAMYLVRAK